jgi:hypothetical protein
MGTLASLQDAGAPQASPDMDNEQQQAPQPEGDPTDGGDPKQMIGWVPQGLPAKLRVYLKMARMAVVSAAGGQMIQTLLHQSPDHVKAMAMFIAKTMQSLESKLGPLADDEYDKVAAIISGWIVSTLQSMGMPGLDDAGGRHDLIGRIMQTVDGLTGHGQGGQPAQGQPPGQPPQGGAGQPPPQPGATNGAGTMPQMGDM